jgi:hypothetical protein
MRPLLPSDRPEQPSGLIVRVFQGPEDGPVATTSPKLPQATFLAADQHS